MWGRARETDTGWVGAGPDDDLEQRLEADDLPFDPQQPHIQTIPGAIDPHALGPTAGGEALVQLSPGFNNPNGQTVREVLPAEIEDAYAAGLRGALCWARNGREMDELSWLARRSPLHLIAVAAPTFVAQRGNSGVGAWLLDVAVETTPDVVDDLMSLWRQHPLAIAIRSADASAAPQVVSRLLDQGCPATRLWVAGCGWRPDRDKLAGVLQLGVSVLFDYETERERAGGNAGTDSARIEDLAKLIQQGFGGQVLLGSGIGRWERLRSQGGPGIAVPIDRFPLELMDAGVAAEDIRRMFIDNPARLLTVGKGNE